MVVKISTVLPVKQWEKTVSLTCGDVVLGQFPVSFDEERSGKEESPAHHGHEGAKQQR